MLYCCIIQTLACRKSEEFDMPMPQWNREMLTKVAIAQGAVESISPRYVSKLLKREKLQPHKLVPRFFSTLHR